MTLSELLTNNIVLPKTPSSSKDELISILMDRIYSEEKMPELPQNEVQKMIDNREEIGGTLLPSGLSIPHARLKGYEGFILALATPAEPLFYGEAQIRLMALMLTSQSGGIYYLPTLAALTKISRDEGIMLSLNKAETPEDFIGIIKQNDLVLL